MSGVGEGIATGIGEGLSDFGNQMRQNRLAQVKTRDKQADDLTEQIKGIADNIAKVGGKDAPEAAPLVQQLKTTIDQHNALFPPHETPMLLQRLKGLMGHKPGAPKPDMRASMNPDTVMAAAPVPGNSILQEVNNLTSVYIKGGDDPKVAGQKALNAIAAKYKTENTYKEAPGEAGKPYKDPATGKWYQVQYDNHGESRPVELPEGYTPDEGWKPLDAEAGKPFKDPKDNKIYQMQVNKAGQTRRAPLEGMTEDALTKKPLEPKINSATGGLDSIVDPNSNKVYTASDIATAPPEVAKIWNDISGQVSGELKRKKDIEDEKTRIAEENMTKRFDQQNKIQEQGLANLLTAKDYGEAKKVVVNADNDYQNALDRMSTMDRNLIDANKGDQQAMLSLVANHIGMTLGAQKGARITRAAFDEAVNSAPWLDKVGAKWSSDGYLSGVTLSPEQMQQMVRLAREKVDVLKDHKQRVENEYHDALNPRPKGKTNTAPAGPAAVGGEKDPLNLGL
jgi:hypothetical protein